MKAKPSIHHASRLLAAALAVSALPSCLSEQQAMGILDNSVKSAAISAIQQSDPIFGRGHGYGQGGYGQGGYGQGGYGDVYSAAGFDDGSGYGGVSGSAGYAGGSGSSGEMFEDPETGAVYQRVR